MANRLVEASINKLGVQKRKEQSLLRMVLVTKVLDKAQTVAENIRLVTDQTISDSNPTYASSKILKVYRAAEDVAVTSSKFHKREPIVNSQCQERSVMDFISRNSNLADIGDRPRNSEDHMDSSGDEILTNTYSGGWLHCSNRGSDTSRWLIHPNKRQYKTAFPLEQELWHNNGKRYKESRDKCACVMDPRDASLTGPLMIFMGGHRSNAITSNSLWPSDLRDRKSKQGGYYYVDFIIPPSLPLLVY